MGMRENRGAPSMFWFLLVSFEIKGTLKKTNLCRVGFFGKTHADEQTARNMCL